MVGWGRECSDSVPRPINAEKASAISSGLREPSARYQKATEFAAPEREFAHKGQVEPIDELPAGRRGVDEPIPDRVVARSEVDPHRQPQTLDRVTRHLDRLKHSRAGGVHLNEQRGVHFIER